MKVAGRISAAALSLLLGIAASALARQEPNGQQQDHPKEQKTAPQEQKNAHEQGKPDQQHAQQSKQSEQKQGQAQKSEQKQEQKQQAQHAQKQGEPETRPPQAEQDRHVADQKNKPRPEQQKREPAQVQAKQGRGGDEHVKPTQEQQRVQQTTWQEHRSNNWQSDHRTWAQRGGYHGYRIPDDQYRGYFGSDHYFLIYGLPFMVEGGYPRFQYGGYWISPVDPWPESWAANWYDTDEVYVTYVDNGYYMYNRRYPSVGIAINISN